MFITGHIAIAYLLSQIPVSVGIPLSPVETIQIITLGNIIDLDIISASILGKFGEKHHQQITHTPFGALIISLVLIPIIKPSIIVFCLILASQLIHLLMDDISYIFYKIGLIKSPMNPQINWLYPMHKFVNHKFNTKLKDVLHTYVVEAYLVFCLEMLLTISAVLIYLF